jgi:hypothetical protein
MTLSYPASVGRNMNEIVRCMKALQLSYNKAIATPADWPENHARLTLPNGTQTTEYKGSVFLLPVVTEDEAKSHYPNYHTCQVPSQKKYLRLVKAEDVGFVPVVQNPKSRDSWQDALIEYRKKKNKKGKHSFFSWFYRLVTKSKSKKTEGAWDGYNL